MNWKGTILDSINNAGGDENFVVSTIFSVREKVLGRNGGIKVLPLKGTFKMDKEVSDIHLNG